MDVHEYQAKSLLKSYGLPVTDGFVAHNVSDALSAAKKLNADAWVVKAQVHAGGRGKAGGIKFAKTLTDVQQHTENLLNRALVTHQTGPEGQQIGSVYIQKAYDLEKEYYLSLVIDRAKKCLTFLASSEGGMDIEEVMHNNPQSMISVSIDPSIGLRSFHITRLIYGLELQGQAAKSFPQCVRGLYEMMTQMDAEMIEINPLAWTSEGWIFLDAKVSFDENALYRQPKLREIESHEYAHHIERQALEGGLNYVKLNGSIGCMVNGAGLAMATMDIIQLHRAFPANFLDVSPPDE